jgi:hypothetical protein
MRAGRLLLAVSLVIHLAACGRATVREVHREDVVIADIKVEAGLTTILVSSAACATSKRKLSLNTNTSVMPAEASRCLRELALGSKHVFVQRQLQFKPMTIGDKPSVTHTLGPCTIPRDAMRMQQEGELCR